MNNTQLKSKIASSYEACTPKVLDKIKAKCENTVQSDYMGNVVPIASPRFNWGQLAGMVAALLIVSTVCIELGRMSVPVSTVENTQVTDSEVAGANQEIKQATKIEIEVEPGVKVIVDENLNITGAVAEDKALEKKLQESGIVGMDAATGLELIHKLIKEVLTDATPSEKTESPKTETKTNESQTKQAPKVENTQIIDPNKPVENEVKKSLDEVEKITDTATDIVEDVTGTATDIIDDATSTTGNVLQDVGESVDKIFNIFK